MPKAQNNRRRKVVRDDERPSCSADADRAGQQQPTNELDELRTLREMYKEKTQKDLDDCAAKLELEKTTLQLKATEGEVVLSHNDRVLKQMAEQQQMLDKLMRAASDRLKSLKKQIYINKKLSNELAIAEKAIRTILEDIKI